MSLPRLERDPDIIIVGAGPVGLWTAIQLKRKNKKLGIVIFERLNEYRRTQDVRLDMANIRECPAILQKLNVLAETGRARINEAEAYIDVPIQELESCLKSSALEYGIEIKTAQVESGDVLRQAYPECRVIIGADGSKSTIRKTAFGDDEHMLVKNELRHMVELKYQVTGEVGRLSAFKSASAQISTIGIEGELSGGVVCHEDVKYIMSNNKSYVTLRFFVPKEIYDDKRLKNAVAASPMPLTSDLPPQLYHAINSWLNRRGDKNYIYGTQYLNKTILPIYRCRKACVINTSTDHNSACAVFLVGDALLGLSYRKGLNAGLECANQLSELLAPHQDSQFVVAKKSYESFVDNLYISKRNQVLKLDRKLTAKKTAGMLYYFSTFLIQNIAAACRDSDHPMFHAKGEAKKRWLWIAAFTLVFAGVAAAITLGVGGLPALAVVGIVVAAALHGFVIGYRLWKAIRSYTEKRARGPTVSLCDDGHEHLTASYKVCPPAKSPSAKISPIVSQCQALHRVGFQSASYPGLLKSKNAARFVNTAPQGDYSNPVTASYSRIKCAH